MENQEITKTDLKRNEDAIAKTLKYLYLAIINLTKNEDVLEFVKNKYEDEFPGMNFLFSSFEDISDLYKDLFNKTYKEADIIKRFKKDIIKMQAITRDL